MERLKWNRQFALDQAADDLELLTELLEIFKGSLAADLAQIEAGLADTSAATISSAAHSIKGASASLGFEGIRELAMAIEEESRSGSLARARTELPTLRQMLALVCRL